MTGDELRTLADLLGKFRTAHAPMWIRPHVSALRRLARTLAEAAPVDPDPDDYLPAWDESGGMGIVARSEPSPMPGMVRHFVHAISPDDAEWIDLPPSIPASAICFDRGYLVVRPQRSRRGELVTLADEPSDPSPTP